MNKKNIFLIIILLWCILIYSLSSMNSKESNTKSKKVIENTIEIQEKVISNNNMNQNTKKKVINELNLPVRKIAHFGIYFILGILVINYLILRNKKIGLSILLGILFCLFYAGIDEYHQTLVQGRTGKISDVLLDLSGSLLGCSSVILFYKNKNKIYSKE